MPTVISEGNYLHHCFSQGMPSLFPSIFVPGQFFRKKVASVHELICEQWVRPSHLKRLAVAGGDSGSVEDKLAGWASTAVAGGFVSETSFAWYLT
jgi:hypothetical protein